MNKAKWFCGKEASTGEIIATSAKLSQPDCAMEILGSYKNVVLYSSDPLSSWRVEGGSGDETSVIHDGDHEILKLSWMFMANSLAA